MYKKVAELMHKHNMTIADLSKATGIPYSTISSWNVGKSKPNFQNLFQIAKYFGVPLEYFAE